MSSPAFNSTFSRYKTFLRTNDDRPCSRDIDTCGHIPDHHNIMSPANSGSSDPKLQCCCGREDCAYLEHNNAAVGDIEKKLERAAQLGQVRARSRMFRCQASTRWHANFSQSEWPALHLHQTCVILVIPWTYPFSPNHVLAVSMSMLRLELQDA